MRNTKLKTSTAAKFPKGATFVDIATASVEKALKDLKKEFSNDPVMSVSDSVSHGVCCEALRKVLANYEAKEK